MIATYHDLIPLDKPDKWREALDGIKHSFSHTWEHCYAMHLTTNDKTFLYTFEKDGVRIVCPIVEREFGEYKDITKPFGFSGFVGTKKHPKFSIYWKEFVQKQGYITGYPGLSPVYDYSDLFDPFEIFHYNNTYILDLQPTVQQILKNMSAGRREQFNNWKELKANFVFDRVKLESFFQEEYYNFLNRMGAASYYYFSPETISYIFTTDNTVMAGAKQSGKIVSLYIFQYTRYMATNMYALSLPEGRHHSAPLIWHCAQELKKKEIPYLNMGGAKGSLAEFKRRFGMQKKPLLSLKQVYKHVTYEKLCRSNNEDPADKGGFFPPYRKNASL